MPEVKEYACRECDTTDPGDFHPTQFYHCKKCYNTYRAANRKKKLDFLRELKTDNPCADCGEFYHWIQMDFDHLHDKEFGLNAQAAMDRNWNDIMDEVAKCDIVCSNCHRLRTMNRADWGVV